MFVGWGARVRQPVIAVETTRRTKYIVRDVTSVLSTVRGGPGSERRLRFRKLLLLLAKGVRGCCTVSPVCPWLLRVLRLRK